MKLLKFKHNGKTYSGIHENNTIIANGTEFDPEKITFLPPVNPPKIICIGFNYKKHNEELKDMATGEPTITLKAPTSVLGHIGKIILPPESGDVQHESELGIVIKKSGYRIKNPVEHILGYTIVNDVTARDIERKMVQWSASKSFPTFCPFGPFIETEINPGDLEITCKINGELRQNARTSQMIYSPEECVKFVSKFMELQKDDLIATGTPPGVGKLEEGDEIEIKIPGIGTLKNFAGK